MNTDNNHSGSPGPLEDAVAYRIYRTARMLRFNLLHMFKAEGYDVTPEQWFILYRLWERDGQSQIELSDRIFNDRPNITRLVDALEKRGLVTRQADPHDRRKFLVLLSDEARSMLEHFRPIVVQERRRMFRGIGPEGMNALREALSILERNLTEDNV